MKLLADENFPAPVIAALRMLGHQRLEWQHVIV